jgi:uncharacterized protein GlcG (DUF336 family)
MDKASLTTISVAENKARCAAFTGFPTGKGSKAGNWRSDFHALAITLAAGADKMVTMQGGAHHGQGTVCRWSGGQWCRP